ncbi:uncharacterized protein LOC103706890 [Phoenix dactylifera]|uniref:Uncharacterized protein LOC103706890 n=1 Tax=Phoenix dactylifera TaxID=42345 RepID=A0A8B7C0V7_PHODC|nr:uncharacterized protein LOC103706890 [Phoenix dactylifera]XP_008789381.2 uncharacterized protein LOC103706890 [Phoenix dactylifera]
MLRNLMEDKRLDFDAPLLSVRRLSAGAAAAGASTAPCTSKSEDSDRKAAAGKPPPRRSSLPFHKSDLKSGPVGNPGVIPFVWEQTPGQPKDGVSSGSIAVGRPPMVSKLPSDRILNERESYRPRTTAGASVRVGTSIRTQKAVTFASDEGTKKAPESPKGGEEKVKEEEEKQKPVPADRHNDGDDDEDEAFSDALDTLSRTESFFMNCSVSGLSGIPESAMPSGSFSTDPQVRDFMMGRFLPAAQAMATGSPQYTFRKAASLAREPPMRPAERFVSGDHRRLLPLPYQKRPNFGLQYAQKHGEGDSYDDEEEAEDCDETDHLPSKACGLLPRLCLKSSFCLLNPVPGMKVRGRLPAPPGRRIGGPRIKTFHHGSFGQDGDEDSWEAVHKHKLGQRYQPQVEDGRSRSTSETKQLTYWSDSPTADGSSPCRRSAGGGISPYRNEAPPLPFERKGFLGVPKRGRKSSKTDGSDLCERDGENYWEMTSSQSSQQGSGSRSPALEKTLYVDSVNMPETPDSNSSSLNIATGTRAMLNSTEKDYEVGRERQRMEENVAVKTHEENALQPKDSVVVEPGLPFCSERSDHGEMDGNNNIKHNADGDGPLHTEEGDIIKNDVNDYGPLPLEEGARHKIDVSSLLSLLPPPLPKSPSESWLFRTLPSVSSKNLPQSFLGLQFQPRKQAFQASSTNQKQDTNAKPSVSHHRQRRFAEVLPKPVSPRSEI